MDADTSSLQAQRGIMDGHEQGPDRPGSGLAGDRSKDIVERLPEIRPKLFGGGHIDLRSVDVRVNIYEACG